MKYRYYIDFGAGRKEFFPDQDATYKWRDARNLGIMRKEVNSLVISVNYQENNNFYNEEIYNTLWEWYFDETKNNTEINLYITKNGIDDYSGIFYVNDGDIDINNGVYTIKPNTDDGYRILLSKMDVEIDIINSDNQSYTGKYTYHAEQQIETGTATNPPNIAPLAEWEQLPGSGNPLWARQVSVYEFSGWTKYGNLWYKGAYDPPEATVTINFTYPNSYKLTDVIQFMIDTLLFETDDYGMQFVSHFFFDTNNYVTGKVNQLMNTLIEQKTDAKDPDASNKALKGVTTLSDFLDQLGIIFNVKWFIDNGDFRIEHQKYFDLGLKTIGTPSNKQICIDLTDASKYTDIGSGKLYIEDTQKFERDDSNDVSQQSINFLEAETYQFTSDNNYISYDIVAESPQVKNMSVNLFVTDVRLLYNDPSKVSDDGFLLLNCYPADENYEATVIEQVEGAVGQEKYYHNNRFSTKWLLYDYYAYGVYNANGVLVYNGYLNEPEYQVITTKPTLIQKDIVFLLNSNDEIDTNKYIATYLNKITGKVKIKGNVVEIEHNLNDDFVTTILGYEL